MDNREMIYNILRKIENEDEPKNTDYNITLEEFGTVIEDIQYNNLIYGAKVIRGGKGNSVVFVYLDNAKIYTAGYKYLAEYNK